MLQVDAHFAPGRSHAVCQDYAAVGPGIAVVCDGCSGAPNSDVGARLLAHAALAAQPRALDDGTWIRQPQAAANAIGLPAGALDATCIVARATDTGIAVTMFGDGVVAARNLDGTLSVIEVSFPHSAPPYPSYALSQDREQAYRDAGLGTPVLLATPDAPAPVPVGAGLSWCFPRARFSSVLVGSDGLAAFRRPDQAFAPALEIIAALFHYPSPNGAFVTRRLRRFLAKEAPGLGLSPLDDVCVAALCWSDA